MKYINTKEQIALQCEEFIKRNAERAKEFAKKIDNLKNTLAQL